MQPDRSFASILGSLPARHQQLLLLSEVAGLTADGIGRVLHISVAETRIRLFAARRDLRQRLAGGVRPAAQ
jgi:DNA-directed RNA polymerase specialized sigma24 family protein